MANQKHLDILKQGVEAWNQWRKESQKVKPDLSDIDLPGATLNDFDLSSTNLSGANLSNAQLNDAHLLFANLSGANLYRTRLWQTDFNFANLKGANLQLAIAPNASFRGTDLSEADLSEARLHDANLFRAKLTGSNLSKAELFRANLERADLSSANLRGAYLSEAYLRYTNLTEANLSCANLERAILVETNLAKTIINDCKIYGISAWDVQLEGAMQFNLVISRWNKLIITVDDLEMGQFIYLLLNNKKIRKVIDTITSKVVLILGRFTLERKQILDTLKDELRKHNYLPVLFDFDKPASRDLTETISTLAHLARFIIVDLTDPSSAPHEVATIIPQTIVPVQPLFTVQPLLIEGKAIERHEYAMFEDLRRRYHWVLPTFRYQDTSDLLASLQSQIIDPAEQKAKELAQR